MGEIFVRIYNEQPTFPLEVGKAVTSSYFALKNISKKRFITIDFVAVL